MKWIRKWLRRAREWFVRLLHLDDTPHRIAMGAAVGMFVAFTPTFGFQIAALLLMLWIIPGNRAAGIPMLFVTNTATNVPIYYFNYRVGVFFLGEPGGVNVAEEWGRVAEDWPSLGLMFSDFGRWWSEMGTWLAVVWDATDDILAQLWLGSIIVGLVAGLLTYPLMYYLVVLFRRRIREGLRRLAHLRSLRAHRHAERRQRHAARDAAKAAGDSGGDGDPSA
jgi:uncharacterized protein (DUF2062 family)